MLSVNDLLVSVFDSTAGQSVLRFNTETHLPLPGGVETGADSGIGLAQGLAVAPDGTYFASSLATGQVLHFSNSGDYLGVLGENDVVQATIFAPGALAFGPNGHLYMADLALNLIYQFDVTSPTQQWQGLDTLSLGYQPGGFTFVPDPTSDIVVGGLANQSVTRYHNGTPNVLIEPGSGINPAAILAKSNGNLLIADFDLGSNPTGHHQILAYNASADTFAQFINLTTPVGTGASAGLPPQPTSLLYDTDGNLLVGLSPDHNLNGAVRKFNIDSGAPLGTVVDGIGTPSGLAFLPRHAEDLLISSFIDTAGDTVLRYNAITHLPVAGSVDTSLDLNTAQGLAVAPDGSFFVSSLGTGQVLHYSNAGVLLGALSVGDAVPATFFAPGALAFGPNGRLYVAELALNVIYQFDVNSPTQQWQAADTLSLGYRPGGFTFAKDDTHEIIVGGLLQQSVIRYNSAGVGTPLIEIGAGINPAAILALQDGDLLIADLDLGDNPTGHHQIVKYDTSADTFAQFINLTTPTGTGPSAGLPPQPSSLLFDTDGNLLVGLSPDYNQNGAVLKFDITDGDALGGFVSNIGIPSGLGFIPSYGSSVADRKLFYNQSSFDGSNAQANTSDDHAIATDKHAYRAGDGPATFANFSSYTKGLNGIMIDLAGAHGTLTASDFVFKLGNSNTVASWADAPTPVSVVVRAGAGVSGTDRVEIIWNSASAVKNSWLEVTLKGNDATGSFNTNSGLISSDVFYFGSRVGDAGSGSAVSAVTNLNDDLAARNNTGAGASITNLYDYDRNGNVQLADSLTVRNNTGTTLKINLVLPAAAPQAAPAVAEQSAIGAGVTLAGRPKLNGQLETWIEGALDRAGAALPSGPLAKIFAQLGDDGPRSRSLLSAAHRLADKLPTGGSLLDGVLDDLGL